MKYFTYFFLCLFLLSCTSNNDKKSDIPKFKTDELSFTVKIDSTFVGEKEYIIGEKALVKEIYTTATLMNRTLETTRFFSMLCAWENLFSTNSPGLTVYHKPCFYDYWFIDSILPSASKSYHVTLIAKPSVQQQIFKLGFNFIRDYQVTKNDGINDSVRNGKHIIWSNLIKLEN